MTDAPPGPVVFHLAVRAEWERAVSMGQPYQRSTLGKSLDEVGFIHCCLAEQVQTVADGFYRGRDDILLLTVDLARVGHPVRMERPVPAGEAFPHIYGPLSLAAVASAVAVPLGPDGRLMTAGLARSEP